MDLLYKLIKVPGTRLPLGRDLLESFCHVGLAVQARGLGTQSSGSG
jgi:hypothetical protein